MATFDYRAYQLNLAQARADARLDLAFSNIVFNPSKHPRGAGGKFALQQGAQGQQVKGAQQKLGIKADGQFGVQTRQAVMNYQRKHNLVVDGVIGSQTAASLLGQGPMAVGNMTAAQAAALAGSKKPKTGPSTATIKPNPGNPYATFVPTKTPSTKRKSK